MKNTLTFTGSRTNPFHLSVGAVVVQGRRVYCHRYPMMRGIIDVYLLMRATVKRGESLERALARGLREEFGMTARPVRYLGSLESSFRETHGAKIWKTTLYFLCTPVRVPGRNVRVKQERHYGCASEKVWRDAGFLVRAMQKQGRVLKRSDFNESAIVARIVR
jgi:hypothetical protein